MAKSISFSSVTLWKLRPGSSWGGDNEVWMLHASVLSVVIIGSGFSSLYSYGTHIRLVVRSWEISLDFISTSDPGSRWYPTEKIREHDAQQKATKKGKILQIGKRPHLASSRWWNQIGGCPKDALPPHRTEHPIISTKIKHPLCHKAVSTALILLLLLLI